jgi:cystathionine beta-lyase
MKFDFTQFIDRMGKDAIAVEMPPNGALTKPEWKDKQIPMWVADQNFPTFPPIKEKMIERASLDTFGYYRPRAEYFDGIIDWHKTRNGYGDDLTRKVIGYDNSVLGGVVSALNVLCSAGDNVLLQSPTYIGFTGCIENNGWNIILNPMYKDENGYWRIDYEDMEKKIVDNKIHATVFCNPHNPTGRAWSKEELEKCFEIFEKHDVWVISDEIWSDIMLDGRKHNPTCLTNEWAKMHTVTCYATSKTYNIAGLVGSYRFIFNDWLRDRVDKQASLSHYNEMNMLWMYAAIGAYTGEGRFDYVDQLCEVLSENAKIAYDYVTTKFKGVHTSRPEATFMLFLDCKEWCEEHNVTIQRLQEMGAEVGVMWQDGRPFHGEYGIRMNLALPTWRVQEAFDRLDKYVFNAE